MTAAAGPSLALRGLVAAGVLAVYGAGASWVVRREGLAYRESLRAASAETAPTESGPPPVAPGPALAASSKPAPVPTNGADPGPTASPEVAVPSPARPEPSAPKGPPSARPKAGPPKAEPAEPLWAEPLVKRAWDLDRMTPEEEDGLGQVLNSLIQRLNPPTEGGPWAGRLQEAADTLREGEPRSATPYTFRVLESDAFNAFSHPGGYIYVTRGLIDAVGEDEIYALQFVLAHEMAHLELRHAMLCLRAPDMRRLEGLGTVEALYKLVIPLSYPDDMEYEADRLALERMAKLGYGRRESLAFLRKLEAYARSHGFSEGRGRPDPKAGGSVVDNHLRAHVSARSRLERAKKILDAGPARAR